MLVCELKEKLGLEYVHRASDVQVSDCYIGDMLSVVMSNAPECAVWLTVQTNINIIAVSVMADIACVVVVEGMEPDMNTVLKAEEQDVNILKTDKSAYSLAKEISDLL